MRQFFLSQLRRTFPYILVVVQVLVLPLVAMAPTRAESAPIARQSSAAIRTPDFDESVRWYQDKLGFRLLSTRNQVQERTALLERDGFLLEIAEADHPMPPFPIPDVDATGTTSVPVISLLVPDVDEEVSRLQARGVEILQGPHDALEGGYRVAQIRDIGRHRIELREPLGSPGSFFHPQGR